MRSNSYYSTPDMTSITSPLGRRWPSDSLRATTTRGLRDWRLQVSYGPRALEAAQILRLRCDYLRVLSGPHAAAFHFLSPDTFERSQRSSPLCLPTTFFSAITALEIAPPSCFLRDRASNGLTSTGISAVGFSQQRRSISAPDGARRRSQHVDQRSAKRNITGHSRPRWCRHIPPSCGRMLTGCGRRDQARLPRRRHRTIFAKTAA